MATVLAPPPELYRADFVAWADEQAAHLRARRFDALDLENLIEEVEYLARERRSELTARLSTIVQHWLKLEMSPARDPRNKWRQTIGVSRVQIDVLLEENPSLRRDLPGAVAPAVRAGAKLAAADLVAYGELDEVRARRLAARSFTLDELVAGELPPGT